MIAIAEVTRIERQRKLAQDLVARGMGKAPPLFDHLPVSIGKPQQLRVVNPVVPNDCVYIWRAEGVEFEGLHVFKVGITTEHVGRGRIDHVAALFGFVPVDVLICRTSEARTVERTLLEMLPLVPRVGNNDGKTEFRAAPAETFNRVRQFMTCLGDTLTPTHPNPDKEPQ